MNKENNVKEKSSIFIFLAFIVVALLCYFVGYLVGRNNNPNANIASVEINQEEAMQKTYQPLVITPSSENIEDEDNNKDMQPVEDVVNTTLDQINDSSEVERANIRYKRRRTFKLIQNNDQKINSNTPPVSPPHPPLPANNNLNAKAKNSVAGKFTVQVYSNVDEVLANNNAKRLSDMGFEKVRIDKSTNMFRVRIGLFDSQSDAEKVKEKLKDFGIKDAFIYHYR